MAGMPGRVGLPSDVATEESLDWRFERGIGRDAPKLFREPRRSTCEGDMLRECMRASDSAMGERVAGTSIAPVVFSPLGTTRVDCECLAGEPLLTIFCRRATCSAEGVEGRCASAARPLSSKAGMMNGYR
jgi:hypothetical protein